MAEQSRLEEIALRRAEIGLERDEQEIDQWEAQRAQKSLTNRQRQSQLRQDLIGRKAVSDNCNHRQGGTPKQPYKGKGDTALKVVLLPDGFSKLVMCAICRLREFSPHPRDKSSKPREGETAAQAKTRSKAFDERKARFDKLLDDSQDAISADFTQPMDCGVTFTFTNEDGNPIYKERPCDTYATV